MLKKVLASIMVVFALVIGVAAFNAESYPKAMAMEYLNDDTNFPIIYEHMKVKVYLDKSSVVVLRDEGDGGTKSFAENFVKVQPNGDSSTFTIWYYFENGVAYFSNDGENFKEFDPFDTNGYMQIRTKGFRWGWPIAFGYQFT